MTSVAAVVVRWKNGDETRRCLASLLDFGGSRLQRIILVDSGSGDGGAEMLATEFPDVQVLALEHNLGFAHAVNRGAAGVRESLLLVLNPDAEVTAQSVDRLADALEDRPDAAGAVPLLVGADGGDQTRWQLRRLPTRIRLAAGLSGPPQFSGPPNTITPVEQPAAAAWLVRRSAWEALDGLDESFVPAWWEDVDFCRCLENRLCDPQFPFEAGFVVVPRARFMHIGGSSIGRLGDAAFLSAFYANLLRYAAKHHPGSLAAIHTGLRWTLAVRMMVNPGRRRAYAAARSAIRPGP